YFFPPHRTHPHLHSFPTRRSSDLSHSAFPKSSGWGDSGRAAPSPGRKGRIAPSSWVSRRGATLRRTPRRPSVRFHRTDRVGKGRSEEHTSELQSQSNLVCRLLLEK